MNGRPTKYRPDYARQAEIVCASCGATNEDLADVFGVCRATINNWLRIHPEFARRVRRGKAIADAGVAQALYSRCVGCNTSEDAIMVGDRGKVLRITLKRHHPPDLRAIKFWLTNRQPKLWSNRVRAVAERLERVDPATIEEAADANRRMLVGDELKDRHLA